LGYTLEQSSFYRNKYPQLIPANVVDCFYELGLTTKNEILADQQNNPPFGSNLCIEIEQIQRIHKTSGTTNNPLLIALSHHDVVKTVALGAKCFVHAGLQSSDIVVHCLNYNMWSGGYTDHECLEKAGAGVIPFGVGNSKHLIDTLRYIKPTAIHCTPSYLSKLEMLIASDYNFNPKDFRLKLGLFGGEGGLQNPNFRKRIEDIWGFKAINANYGLSEIASMFASESLMQDGLLFQATDYLYVELINPADFTKVEIEHGAEGELVLTHLDRLSQPLIRYRTNDIIRILEIVPSGVTPEFRFDVVGRSDEMFVYKGVNVFLSAIVSYINSFPDELNGEFRVQINKELPIDKLKLIIELRQSIVINNSKFIKEFTEGFVDKMFFQPIVEIVLEGSLPRTEGKTKIIQRIL